MSYWRQEWIGVALILILITGMMIFLRIESRVVMVYSHESTHQVTYKRFGIDSDIYVDPLGLEGYTSTDDAFYEQYEMLTDNERLALDMLHAQADIEGYHTIALSDSIWNAVYAVYGLVMLTNIIWLSFLKPRRTRGLHE